MYSYNEDIYYSINEAMIMAEAIREQVERVTVYLTPQNKQRLASLRRGQKTKKLNEVLNQAFEVEDRKNAFEEFMQEVGTIEPVEPIMSSIETVRKLRAGLDHDVSDKRNS